MLRNLAEVGEGRLWAIHEAQRVAGMDLERGLEACANHIDVATETRLAAIHESSSPTHIRSCAKFVTQTQAIIDAWEETDGRVLPLEHFDFGYDLASHDGRLRVVFNSYNPSKLTADAAVNNFRVARLALPEVLRAHDPKIEEAKAAGLTRVRSSLHEADTRISDRFKRPTRQSSRRDVYGYRW